MVVPVCLVLCVSWSGGCGSHWNGCMNVAYCVLWGGSRSTKPCAFPYNKVAAGDDERYLVCATGAAGVVSCANWFLLCALQRVVVSVRVVLCGSCIFGCGLQWNGCVKVAWAILWGGSRSTKPCVFPYKVAAGDDERYTFVHMCGGCGWGRFMRELVPPMCFATSGCVCACSSMRFLNLWLQIALEWLRQGCMGYLVGREPEHETLCFAV